MSSLNHFVGDTIIIWKWRTKTREKFFGFIDKEYAQAWTYVRKMLFASKIGVLEYRKNVDPFVLFIYG